MSSVIMNAVDMKKGKTSKPSVFSMTLWQPLQMLPEKDKDADWTAWNCDFLEYQSMKQMLRNKEKYIGNYKIAAGEIERKHYIREQADTEAIQIADTVGYKELEATKLKYYSLTDNVVNIMCNEMSERTSLLNFDLSDPISFNELIEHKEEDLANYLMQEAAMKQMIKMVQMGISEESEEGQQMMDEKELRNIPQIQKFYDEGFRSVYQDWAWHTMKEDESRFNMKELETINFRHSLIVDREFWHFRMLENDYELEVWDPMLVAYQKSPHCKYMSGASWVVHSTEMTVADVIDRYGWQMSPEQLYNLSRIYPAAGVGTRYNLPGLNNASGDFYDSSRSYEWNTQGPGIAMRQYLSARGMDGKGFTSNVVREILYEGEDLADYGDINLCRVSTIYWTTQRKMYWLTAINEAGEKVEDIVSEHYKVTDKPEYNTDLYKEKSRASLIKGEHLDLIWVNEKWGGVKIGPNIPSWAGMQTTTGLQPMYIGYNNGKPGRLPYQFKGDKSLTGSKLPVEGCVFTDLTGNTRSRSLVDRMKSWQIGYNMLNNMIMDVTIDEMGVIAAFNPDLFPKYSFGDDWQTGNFSKIIQTMRSGYLPTNRSIQNADGAIDQRDIERVDLTQSARFQSLMERAEYFKRGALESIGITPQRAAASLGQEQTATQIRAGIAASYAQTEHYFTQHSDYLMPRVHQMRTDLAQYYASKNPSLRIQYTTESNAKRWMELNGTELMGRDFGVKCKSNNSSRSLLNKIQQYLLSNNTLADHMPDQINAMKAQNMTEMDELMESIDRRREAEEQQRIQMEQQQYEQNLELQEKLLQEKQAFEAEENEKDRQADIYKAEIMAAGRAATAKTPDQGAEAYEKGLDRIEEQQNFRETMNMERQRNLTQTKIEQQKLQVRQNEIQAENMRTRQMAQAQKVKDKVKAKNEKNKKK